MREIWDKISGVFEGLTDGVKDVIGSIKGFITDFTDLANIVFGFIPEPYNEILLYGVSSIIIVIIIKVLGKVVFKW